MAPQSRAMHLSSLTGESATSMLSAAGVTGSAEDLGSMATWSEGHPLMLRLLATALSRHGGETSEWRGHLEEVRRAVDGLVDHLNLDEPNQALAWFASLFELPFSSDALAAVSSPLASEKEPIEERLAALGILERETTDDLGVVYRMHPLMRAAFRRRFADGDPDGYIAANGALFERTREDSPQVPQTDDEARRLRAAVHYGLEAEWVSDAF